MERWKRLEKKPAPMFIPKFGPLNGLRVMFNGTIVAGPFVATMFADFGAEVIVLERPKVPDPYRLQNPQIVGENGKSISGAWMQNARNKLSLSLETNFEIPESREIFLSMVKNCDVWVENMVWIDKLGITNEELLEVNPRLVICNCNGFGRPAFGGLESEMARASYDPIGQAVSGYHNLQGFPPGGDTDSSPLYASQYIGDYVVALFGFSGIMMALREVERTGKGQIVENTQAECMMRVMDDNWALWDQIQYKKTRFGHKISFFQPGDVYMCGDGKYINIGAFGEAVYNRFMKAVGLSVEEYPYKTAAFGVEALASEKGIELDRKIHEWCEARTALECSDILNANRVGAGVVFDCEDVMGHEHWKLRNCWATYKDETLQRDVTCFGMVPKFSETPGKVWRGAPTPGQDTEAILKQLLEYTDAEYEALKGKGVID